MFLERIENKLAAGLPDVYWQLPWIGGWCELKVGRWGKERLMIDYPIHQRKWAQKYILAGGNYLLCVSVDKELWWWYGNEALVADTMSVEAAKMCSKKGAAFPTGFF